MPYILKPNKLFVKDPEGTGFLPQNVVTDKATSDAVAEIKQASFDEQAAIEAKGAQTRASVPEDYTTLSDSVKDLKSAFLQFTGAMDSLNIAAYEKGSITTTTGANSNYRKDSRARTISNTIAPFDFTLEPFNTTNENTNYYFTAVFYNPDGTWQSTSDAIYEGSSLTISEGQIYRLLIGDITRQESSSVISLEDLVSHIKITSAFNTDIYAFISASSGSDDYTGVSTYPFKTIGFALSNGFRKLKVEPGVYNEQISLDNGTLEIVPWVDNQNYSESNAPYRPKIKLIKGAQLTVSASETAGIYQASFTAASGTNIYKVFIDHTLTPTTSGSLALEYNAMLVGDMPNTSTASKAFSPYRQRLLTPVLTEGELSAEGTFFYDGTNHLIKFHPWNDSADGEYYVPDDDVDNIISLQNMESVHMEDVKAIGCYDNCIYINKCDNVMLNACEVGYSGKGMGIKLDYTNARVSDCHAYAISADGFNLHGYGYSEIVGCTAFHCGDDGISHHEGCSGFIDGGEWAYNGDGGITPSFGSQIDVRNANAHHNKIGIQWLGLAVQSRYAKMCNCLSIDNTTSDIYVKWYVVEAWNNIFRTKDSQYNSARSALIEYGTVTPN